MGFPSVIYIIRHGEKWVPHTGPYPTQKERALYPKGKERAKCLVDWAREHGISPIYTVVPDLAAIRPKQTGLLAAFHLDIPLYPLWIAGDVEGLVEALGTYKVSENKPALVIWVK